ncbi:MAG: hypothetical protein H0U92_04930 [Actinobacteria bacterium]|nr:hypothetical protein [Actinomycetota bacterium]
MSADGALWTFNVTELARGTVIDVALVPQPVTSAAFSVTFAAPEENAFSTAAVSPGGPAADENAPVPAPGVSGRTASPFEYAAPPLGGFEPAFVDSFAQDDTVAPIVDAAPAPRRIPSRGAEGHREPLALLIVAFVLGVWFWRLRIAVAAAESHPLAGSLASSLAGLESGEALISAEDLQ